jgi:hypothetical protein
MSASWPTSLPDKPVLGWTEKLGANSIRSQNEVGPASVRRRGTSAPSTFSMPFILTENQADTLMDFYQSTTASGVHKFTDLAHPRTDSSSVEWRFLSPPEISCSEKGTYFDPVSETSVNTPIYTVTLALELLP